ncbi:hypothetical protein DPMN_177596 [Dreissena polymorpha]|uniref:Uncharacterized protein n=1 Tax=Dreissena polymorpha TaxID=45954 RepID=A0A9D4IJ54_DREPO|nr:hypothetical protein DPMN_177596 [Dreissena polymorpha]
MDGGPPVGKRNASNSHKSFAISPDTNTNLQWVEQHGSPLSRRAPIRMRRTDRLLQRGRGKLEKVVLPILIETTAHSI